ncbi:MAG: hypothetical protein MSG77_04860 [Prevotella sp.]|nr:hypothetical protein [Prevotella sp.]
MKKQNIIYGVAGMLEYQALIKVGSAKMKIPFTNGSSNEAGRTPATFSTSNTVIQLAIENSKEFKAGLISRVHVAKTDEDVYIESEHVALQGDEVADTHTPADETGNNEVPAEDEQGADTPDKAEQEQATEETSAMQPVEETINTVTRKEFACNDDAKDFFETEFGVKRSTLRNRADIIACGKSNGIDVVFTD